MQTIIIATNVTLTATDATIATYERELRELEIDCELREWLNTHDPSDELYSDIYKDVYGIRPRWLY